jgi:hypothetical protein
MFDNLERVKNLLTKASYINTNQALNCLPAKIVSIADPQEKSRCKVELYNFTSTDNAVSYASDWSSPLQPFNGILPESFLNKQVLAFTINNSYESLLIVLPGPLIYKENESLPEASFNNLGLEIIILGNSESFKAICTLRNNQYTWEKICPLSHGHTSGHSQQQFRDSSGDIQMPIPQLAINDQIFGTAVTPYVKDSETLPPILT